VPRFEGPVTAGFYVTMIYLFDLFARLPEFTSALLGTALAQSPILMVVALAFAFTSGHILDAFQMPVGRWLLAYMAWITISLPFGYWKSASLQSYSYTIRYFLLFVLTITLVRSIPEVRKAIVILAFTPIPILIAIRLLGAETGGRLQLSLGSFSNSNELASYMIMLSPLALLVASMKRYNWLLRGTAFLLCLACIMTASRTGSRGAILTLAVVISVLFISYGIRGKVTLVAVFVPLMVILLALTPREALLRYMTTFKQQEGLGAEAAQQQRGALASTESRGALFRESIKVTMDHPLFGVGVGAFTAAAAAKSAEEGKRALWQVTHNAYTQVSSESGIPSLIFYLMACWCFVRDLWRISRRPNPYRLAARGTGYFPAPEETRQLAMHLLLAYAAIATYGLFASTAGEFSFFVLLGLGAALSRAHTAEAAAYAVQQNARPDTGPLSPSPASPAFGNRPPARRDQVRPVESRQAAAEPAFPPVRRIPRQRNIDR
jgi:O-antigen ligase